MEPDLPHAKQLCAAARREANAAEWSSLGSAQHSGCSHFSMPGPGTDEETRPTSDALENSQQVPESLPNRPCGSAHDALVRDEERD